MKRLAILIAMLVASPLFGQLKEGVRQPITTWPCTTNCVVETKKPTAPKKVAQVNTNSQATVSKTVVTGGAKQEPINITLEVHIPAPPNATQVPQSIVQQVSTRDDDLDKLIKVKLVESLNKESTPATPVTVNLDPLVQESRRQTEIMERDRQDRKDLAEKTLKATKDGAWVKYGNLGANIASAIANIKTARGVSGIKSGVNGIFGLMKDGGIAKNPFTINISGSTATSSSISDSKSDAKSDSKSDANSTINPASGGGGS